MEVDEEFPTPGRDEVAAVVARAHSLLEGLIPRPWEVVHVDDDPTVLGEITKRDPMSGDPVSGTIVADVPRDETVAAFIAAAPGLVEELAGMLEQLLRASPATVAEVERGPDGWRFHGLAGNHVDIVGHGGEGFTRRGHAEEMARRTYPFAEIREATD